MQEPDRTALHLSQDPEAVALISKHPLALLLGIHAGPAKRLAMTWQGSAIATGSCDSLATHR